jgi:plastocyanin
MNNIFTSGLIVILSAYFGLMVASIPYDVSALVVSHIGNSEDIVYVSASPSSNNTTGESSGESGIESSTVVSLITISKGPQGNTVFNPPVTTVKTGGEVLIFNNDTAVHTIKSGMGPSDPLAGRLFGVGPIQPKGYIEYVASNLQPGTYPFYSTHDPSIKGELVVTN